MKDNFDFLEFYKDPDSMTQRCVFCERCFSISEINEDGICFWCENDENNLEEE